MDKETYRLQLQSIMHFNMVHINETCLSYELRILACQIYIISFFAQARKAEDKCRSLLVCVMHLKGAIIRHFTYLSAIRKRKDVGTHYSHYKI